MNIDNLEGLDEETRKEIEELLEVTREKDGGEAYAESQFEIGIILAQSNDISSALSVWEDIKRTDNPSAYAYAQLNIGIAFEKNRDIKNALYAWSNIKRTDNPNVYAHAQLNSGVVFDTDGDVNSALIAWENVKREDDIGVYSKAQYNLGLILYREGNKESALSFLEAIERSDSYSIYAQSRYLAAQIFREQDKYERALKKLCDINDSDDPRVYAQAELIIASLMKDMDSYIGFLEALFRVKRENHAIHYAFAQSLIGYDFKDKGDIEGAIKIWSGILSSDNMKIYTLAQYEIGKLLICDNELKKYSDAREAFIKAESYYPYEAYCYKKICDLLLDVKLEAVGEKAWQLLDETLKIVEILQLDFGNSSNEIKSPERKLAHYTSTSVANILLESNGKGINSSFFRLNTINNVNDPSEGHLLVNYLEGIKENYFYAPDFDKSLHAFISCFTFNHDSLNQFRLYGKEADKEASGVSLVFEKEFFQSDNSLEGLSFLSLKNNSQNSDETIFPLESDQQLNTEKSVDGKFRINKQPVMRCVYIDPTSDYIQLAHRNRLTFFREFGDETIVAKDEILSKAEHEWGNYKKYIDEKTIDFSDAFRALKNNYELIIKEKKGITNSDLESSNKIDTLINEILLPLKYLIKHSAFQEEQECRMIYVTSLNAPEVKMVNKKFLFVDYESDVKESLNKVYIAPAARDYQMYLAWLLRDKDIKIELSNNPYRQT